MKSKLNPKLQLARAGLVVALGISGAAAAQTYPKEGNYDLTSCWSGVSNVIAFSKAHTAFGYELMGAAQSNPPGGIFDKVTFRCVGVRSVFDGKVTSTAVCEQIDAQGDKYLTTLTTDGQKATRTVIAGTGKYDGMVSSGTATRLGPFPTIKPGTFQDCNRMTGTYKLK